MNNPPWTIPAVEPTDDPAWYQEVEPCGDDCHHPVHGLGRPERMRHLVDADTAQTALANGWIEGPTP